MAWDGKGSDRRWRKYRKRVLDDRGWICELQIPGICTKHATHVHHPTTWTGHPADYPPSQAQAACPACNRHVGEPPTDPDPEPKPWT